VPGTLPHLEEVRSLRAVPGLPLLGRVAGAVRRGLGTPNARGFGGMEAPHTPFSRPLSAHRRFAFGSLPLAEVKAVKQAHAVTVNDVVVSLCAGALRRWLVDHDALPDQPLVSQIPILASSSVYPQTRTK